MLLSSSDSRPIVLPSFDTDTEPGLEAPINEKSAPLAIKEGVNKEEPLAEEEQKSQPPEMENHATEPPTEPVKQGSVEEEGKAVFRPAGIEAYEVVRNQLYEEVQPLKEEILNEARKAKEALIEEGLRYKERLIQEAHQESQKTKERLLSDALAEAEELKRGAFEEGRKEGVLQGKKSIEAEAKTQLEALKALLNEMGSLKPKVISECERDIIGLSVQVAEKILQREVQLDPGTVLDLASRVIKEFEGRSGGIRVKLNPEDYAYILQLDPKILEDKGLSEVVFEKDPSLQRGGCTLETYQGRVDARIEKQLEVIRQKLLERAGHA
jgi:flagellar assembly protein FliH